MKRTLSIVLLLSLFLCNAAYPVVAETSQGFGWSYSGYNRYHFYLDYWTAADAFDFGFYADVNTTGIEIPDPLTSWDIMPDIPVEYNLTVPGDGELDIVEAILGIYAWSIVVPIGNWTHMTNITESRTHTQFGEGVISIQPFVDVDDEYYWGFNYTFSNSQYDYEVYSRYFKSDGVLSSWLFIGYDGSDGSLFGLIDVRRDGTPPTTTYPTDMIIESGSVGNELTWSVYDDSSGYYMVYLDDVSFLNGTLNGGDVNVTITLDDLELGVHRFNATFYDAGGNSTFDIVLVEVVDTTAPSIDSPDDVSYQEGTEGHTIQWSPSDVNPLNYEIYLDGVLILESAWDGGQITFDIDGLTMGAYTYTIVVYDVKGHSVTDDVIVEVTISTLTLGVIGGGTIVLLGVAVTLKRR
ncbi:MAG: hypothetical protein ACFFEJ_04945 [Candidatus Thorarchaeota archaeon]